MNEPNCCIHGQFNFRIGVFADDILAAYKRDLMHEYSVFKKAYSVLINIDSLDICPCVKFTGVQVSRDRQARTVTLHKTRYIEQMAEEYKDQFKLKETPHGESKDTV